MVNRSKSTWPTWIWLSNPSFKRNLWTCSNLLGTFCLVNLFACGHWIKDLRGSPLRPFPRVLLCPLSILKHYDSALVVVSIWTSLVLLFFGSMGRGRGLLSMGKQSIRKTCPCPATPCYKKAELFRPPWISITDFNIRCHLAWKVVGLIGGGSGVRGKKPGFL